MTRIKFLFVMLAALTGVYSYGAQTQFERSLTAAVCGFSSEKMPVAFAKLYVSLTDAYRDWKSVKLSGDSRSVNWSGMKYETSYCETHRSGGESYRAGALVLRCFGSSYRYLVFFYITNDSGSIIQLKDNWSASSNVDTSAIRQSLSQFVARWL